MELNAVDALSALAHEARLSVFRTLVKAGPGGLAAGDLAKRVGCPANTLSAQLNILSSAHLIQRNREGRSVIYRANFEAISQLIIYLMEDCCEGHQMVRGTVLNAAKPCC